MADARLSLDTIPLPPPRCFDLIHGQALYRHRSLGCNLIAIVISSLGEGLYHRPELRIYSEARQPYRGPAISPLSIYVPRGLWTKGRTEPCAECIVHCVLILYYSCTDKLALTEGGGEHVKMRPCLWNHSKRQGGTAILVIITHWPETSGSCPRDAPESQETKTDPDPRD